MPAIVATTIIALVLSLASAGIVEGNRQLVANCCDLGYGHFTFSRKTSASGLYALPNLCREDHLEADAYCDTVSGGGGWLVVQRRKDGSVDFGKNWLQYENGFGELSGEFWYGLRALHCLTGNGGWEMRIDMQLPNGTWVFVQYKQFTVASAYDKYKLTVTGFQGTSTNDPMAYHNGMYFTTYDKDNDKLSANCANEYGLTDPAGGWWHYSCWSINPNGYLNHRFGAKLNGQWHKIPFYEMKIRPLNCHIN